MYWTKLAQDMFIGGLYEYNIESSCPIKEGTFLIS
jgi:hypothetical protein